MRQRATLRDHVLAVLRRHGPLTAAEVARLIRGYKPASVAVQLSELTLLGLVSRAGKKESEAGRRVAYAVAPAAE
jgi:DNA-binding HxlR family transcriptional regulator